MNDTFYKILPNGVKIVHRFCDSEVAYVGIMCGAGTRDESEEMNGMAHYIEHCVFKGVLDGAKLKKGGKAEISARQIINRIEGVGGEVNAYTTKEETTFYAATPVNHFHITFSLLADMVLHPTFPKEETDKEVGVILEEIESYEDSPSELIYDDFEGLIFKGHPLAMPILGTKKTLRRISKSADNPKEWMARNYRPDNMVVFTRGRMNFRTVENAVLKEFGDLTPYSSYTPPLQTACEGLLDNNHSPNKQERIIPTSYTPQNSVFRKHTHQTHVMLGGRAYPIGHKKQLGLYLLNNILGGENMSSRLNLSLREQKGLVYTVDSQYTPLSDTGYWSIYYACDDHHRDECMECVRKELKRMREETMSTTALERAKTQLRGQMAISAENQENNVLAMGKLMLYHGAAPTWQETFREIEKLKAKELQEIAQEIFDENCISILTYE